MTVKELIELNQMIVDAEIEIREGGHLLLDALLIGPSVGQIPPHPREVPKGRGIPGGMTSKKMAYYTLKSINAWDDGKDYWQVKPERIPKEWQDLEVFSWGVWPASTFGVSKRRRTENSPNVNFHGQRINIIALPSGESMDIPEPKQEKEKEQDNQLNLFDMEWKDE